MTESTSPYHDMAVYGTLCLNNVGDESFFIGIKGKMDAEWMQEEWAAQVALHIPRYPSFLSICCPSLGPGRLSATSYLTWALLLFSDWLWSMNVACKRLESERNQSISSSLLGFSTVGLALPLQFLPGSSTALILALIGFCKITFLLLPLET